MISIIIPTLNEEKAIAGTLQKLKSSLTSVPHEIIVSDGHSTDKTVEIAKQFADTVLEHDGKTRQTIAMGRNAGARCARGEYLLFLDADCSIPKANEFLSHAISRFEHDPKLMGLVPWLKVGPQYATLADKFFSFLVNIVYATCNNILQIPVSGGEFQMMRKSTFDELKGYREDLVASEDFDLLRRLGKKGKTRLETNYEVWQTGRRVHKTGWIPLIYSWMINSIWYFLFKKSLAKEWTVVR